jgi:hypothetical protein
VQWHGSPINGPAEKPTIICSEFQQAHRSLIHEIVSAEQYKLL